MGEMQQQLLSMDADDGVCDRLTLDVSEPGKLFLDVADASLNTGATIVLGPQQVRELVVALQTWLAKQEGMG